MKSQLRVRPERTRWRDEALSARHRKWGFHCPAVDLDLILCEYDTAHVAAINRQIRRLVGVKRQVKWLAQNVPFLSNAPRRVAP
jgi:hypothetical protein